MTTELSDVNVEGLKNETSETTATLQPSPNGKLLRMKTKTGTDVEVSESEVAEACAMIEATRKCPKKGAIPIASVPEKLQGILETFDDDNDGLLSTEELSNAARAWKETKKRNKLLTFYLIGLFALIMVILLVNFGLSFAVAELSKETRVEKAKSPDKVAADSFASTSEKNALVKAGSDITVSTAEALTPGRLTSELSMEDLRDLRHFEVKSPSGAFLRLAVQGLTKVPNSVLDGSPGSLLILYTTAGRISIDREGAMTFTDDGVTKGVFQDAGFAVTSDGRRLLGLYELVGFFNALSELSKNLVPEKRDALRMRVGLSDEKDKLELDDRLPTVPQRFNAKLEYEYACVMPAPMMAKFPRMYIPDAICPHNATEDLLCNICTVDDVNILKGVKADASTEGVAVVSIPSTVTSDVESGYYKEVFEPAGFPGYKLHTLRNESTQWAVTQDSDGGFYNYFEMNAPPVVDYSLLLALVFDPTQLKRNLTSQEFELAKAYNTSGYSPIIKLAEEPFTYKGVQDMRRQFRIEIPTTMNSASMAAQKALRGGMPGLSDDFSLMTIDYYDSKRTLDPIMFLSHNLKFLARFTSFEATDTPLSPSNFPSKSTTREMFPADPVITSGAYQGFDFTGTRFEGYQTAQGVKPPPPRTMTPEEVEAEREANVTAFKNRMIELCTEFPDVGECHKLDEAVVADTPSRQLANTNSSSRRQLLSSSSGRKLLYWGWGGWDDWWHSYYHAPLPAPAPAPTTAEVVRNRCGSGSSIGSSDCPCTTCNSNCGQGGTTCSNMDFGIVSFERKWFTRCYNTFGEFKFSFNKDPSKPKDPEQTNNGSCPNRRKLVEHSVELDGAPPAHAPPPIDSHVQIISGDEDTSASSKPAPPSPKGDDNESADEDEESLFSDADRPNVENIDRDVRKVLDEYFARQGYNGKKPVYKVLERYDPGAPLSPKAHISPAERARWASRRELCSVKDGSKPRVKKGPEIGGSVEVRMSPCFDLDGDGTVDNKLDSYSKTLEVKGCIGFKFAVGLEAGPGDEFTIGCSVELGIEICVSASGLKVTINFRGYFKAGCGIGIAGGSFLSAEITLETNFAIGYQIDTKAMDFKWSAAIEVRVCILFVCWSNKNEFTIMEVSGVGADEPLGKAPDRVTTYCANRWQRDGWGCEDHCKCRMYDAFREGYNRNWYDFGIHDWYGKRRQLRSFSEVNEETRRAIAGKREIDSDIGSPRRRLQSAPTLSNAQLREGFRQVMTGGMDPHDADEHYMVVCEAHTYGNCQVREDVVEGRRGQRRKLNWGWSLGKCWSNANKYGVGGELENFPNHNYCKRCKNKCIYPLDIMCCNWGGWGWGRKLQSLAGNSTAQETLISQMPMDDQRRALRYWHSDGGSYGCECTDGSRGACSYQPVNMQNHNDHCTL